MSLEQRITRAWNHNSRWLLCLIPLSWLFAALSAPRRVYLQGKYQGHRFSAPVVIVGNITVGGSGKTPLIISLITALKERGFSPGVVSRGYAGCASSYPLSVTADTAVSESGDEPLLIATLTGCPMVVDANRTAAVRYLLGHFDCDVVLCDDGLQHYRLHRDIEMIVVDGQRGLGNSRLLPAGPLRERPQRLKQADFVVVNGGSEKSLFSDPNIASVVVQAMSVRPTYFTHLQSGRRETVEAWLASYVDTAVHAVAAIGNPQRFADTLSGMGLSVTLQSFDDHQALTAADLTFTDDLAVIVTAKDAIKLSGQVANNIWSLDVEADIAPAFIDKLAKKLQVLNEPLK